MVDSNVFAETFRGTEFQESRESKLSMCGVGLIHTFSLDSLTMKVHSKGGRKPPI